MLPRLFLLLFLCKSMTAESSAVIAASELGFSAWQKITKLIFANTAEAQMKLCGSL